MIKYNDNQEIVIKDMHYNRLNNKLSTKQKKKQKYINKLQSKNNTITLKFGGNGIKYINPISRERKNKKITQEISVRGFFKNVAVGKRGEGNTIKKWIEPFVKCVQGESENNKDFVNKVYKVS